MASVTVLYFASIRDRLRCDREQLDLTGCGDDVALRAEIARRHPQVAELLSHCRIAVDQCFVSGALDVRDGAEIALIPPVSGG